MPDPNGRIDLSDEVPTSRANIRAEHLTDGSSPATVSTRLELSEDETPSRSADITFGRQSVRRRD